VFIKVIRRNVPRNNSSRCLFYFTCLCLCLFHCSCSLCWRALQLCTCTSVCHAILNLVQHFYMLLRSVLSFWQSWTVLVYCLLVLVWISVWWSVSKLTNVFSPVLRQLAKVGEYGTNKRIRDDGFTRLSSRNWGRMMQWYPFSLIQQRSKYVASLIQTLGKDISFPGRVRFRKHPNTLAALSRRLARISLLLMEWDSGQTKHAGSLIQTLGKVISFPRRVRFRRDPNRLRLWSRHSVFFQIKLVSF
jgi:hypothetical protein